MSQLSLDLDPVSERRYLCCGELCSGMHSESCPNPNIGTWFDRWGNPLVKLRRSDCDRGR